jgi:3-dehydroquinate dehydratase
MPIRLDADSSQRQWFRIFETLAVASSFGHRPLVEAIQAESRRLSRNSGLIVITASQSHDWIMAAQSLIQRQVPVTAVLIGNRHDRASDEATSLVARLADAHVAVAQMSPGERFVLAQRSLSTAVA